MPPSTTSPTSPRRAGSAIAATRASRAARSAPRSPTGRSSHDRLASHRKLERELARAAREGDPRARAEHRRTWKIIHKSRRRAHAPQVRRGNPMTATTTDPPRDAGGRARRSRRLAARYFDDASDYERLAELTIAASLADEIPWCRPPSTSSVELDAADGADPVDDVVLVEIDGRVVAAAGVERVVRDDVPNYEIWGTVHPDVPASRSRDLAAGLDSRAGARARLARGPARPRRARRRSPRTPRSATGRCWPRPASSPVRHFFLMRRQGARRHPGRARSPTASRSDRSPRTTGGRSSMPRTRRSATTGVTARWTESDFKKTFAPRRARHQPVGRRLGRRPGRRRGPELDLARGERAARRQARLARAHQRPPAVAPPRPRPGDHRGLAASVPRASGSTRRCSASIRENPNGALGLYEGLGFSCEPSGGLPADLKALTAGQANRRRRRGRAPSRPARARSSWPGRGRAGRRRGPRARPAGRARRPSPSASPPGRSTRPQPPANSVSPLNSRPSSSARRQTEPSVWPGVWRTRRRISPKRMIAALGQLDGRHGRRDLERRPERLRVGRAARGRAGGRRSRRPCARRPRRCRRCGPSGRGSRRSA